MSADRVIPAQRVEAHRIESFPYFTARFSHPLPDGAEGQDDPDSDAPVGAALSNPEEDARRLASIDQQIFEKIRGFIFISGYEFRIGFQAFLL